MQRETIAPEIAREAVDAWVERYVHAWRTNDPADIAALFAEDAEYHETPYTTRWVGRDEIVTGWRDRWEWQQGGWSFEWEIRSVEGATAVVHGVGHYTRLGDFDNLWTLAFDKAGRCTRFHMVNTEKEDTTT
ncbi:nuclear transport factor 2 family protein [Streptomyces sp. NPDC002018]|uniref:nuclear transport factor 2 family protein n=1 Tax=Streptomyces sp. NPDC002018 TaxID=3364629 RepID=UPI0036C909C6